MIKLDIPLFCQECQNMKPIVEQTVVHASSINGEILRTTHTLIKCKHEDRCRSIYKYMEKTREKNKLYNEVRKEGGEII